MIDVRYGKLLLYNRLQWIKTTMNMLLCLFVLHFHFHPAAQATAYLNDPHWAATESWSPCSATCGPGTQTRQYNCVKLDLYNVIQILNAEMCINAPKPQTQSDNQITRTCNLGSCRGYRWRVSNWGHCSQTCGGFGTMSRDVDCVYTSQLHDILVPEKDAAFYCDKYEKPEKHSTCNRFTCIPEFVPDQWGKCIQTNPCHPGRQVRQLLCISMQANGMKLELPRAACYMLGRPKQRTWRRCFVLGMEKCEDQEPTIETDATTIVQMRRTKLINLQIGQKAFLIPYTRIVIKCPVQYFSKHEITWTHSKHGRLQYAGMISDRISVDKQGRLHIRSFRSMDEGSWICIAGNRMASIYLSSRTPAAGFHDWIQRNRLWVKGMMSDDPKVLASMHVLLQWVEGPWSACSNGCGESGEQSRTVRCERVDARVYEILEDRFCLEKLLPKPVSKRKCSKGESCPIWYINDLNSSVVSLPYH